MRLYQGSWISYPVSGIWTFLTISSCLTLKLHSLSQHYVRRRGETWSFISSEIWSWIRCSTVFSRKQMYLEQRGVPRLLALIQTLVSNAKGRSQERSGSHPTLSDDEVNVINEVLRLLFNVILGIDSNFMDEEECSTMVELTDLVQTLLTIQTENEEKITPLHSWVFYLKKCIWA